MKRQFLLSRLLLLFALIVGSSSVWAETVTYTVASTSSVNVSGTAPTGSSATFSNTYSTKDQMTKGNSQTESSGTISTTTASPMEFTLETAGEGKYALKMSNNKYLGYDTSTNFRNSQTGSTNTKEQWTISYNSTYSMFTIVNVSNTGRHIGAGSNVFKPYASMSSNAPATLYKKQGAVDTRTAVNISTFSAGKTTLVVGETTTTTVTNDQVGWTASYTYSSSNNDVATVSSSGVITAVSKGNANITVTPNVDPSDPTYKQGNSKLVAITVKKPSHQASIYLSGVKISDEPIEEGSAISFPTVPKSLGGKSFMGWKKDTPIDGTTDVAPTLVRLANMEDADVSYYAVYATVSGNNVTAQLTTNEIKGNLTSTAIAYGTEKTYNDTSDGIQWVACGYTDAANRPWVQMRKKADSYWKITASDNINEITLTISSASNTSGGITDITKHTAFSGTAYLESSVKENPTDEYGSSNEVTDNILTLYSDPNTPSKVMYIQVDAGARVWGIEVKHANLTYTGYCTTVTNTLSLNALCTDGMLYYGTYSSSDAFIVPSDLIVSEISIVDGKLYVEDYDTGDVVPANTGVMVSSDTYGSHSIVLNTGGTSVLGASNCLKPSGDAGINASAMAEAAPDCKYYRLTMHNGTQIGYYWGAASGAAFALAANKAYLAVPKSIPSSTRSGFSLFGDDETTGIEAVDVNTESTNVAREYYNLNGQRVANPSKGLYIVNGKKVIIK